MAVKDLSDALVQSGELVPCLQGFGGHLTDQIGRGGLPGNAGALFAGGRQGGVGQVLNDALADPPGLLQMRAHASVRPPSNWSISLESLSTSERTGVR